MHFYCVFLMKVLRDVIGVDIFEKEPLKVSDGERASNSWESVVNTMRADVGSEESLGLEAAL